MLRGALRIVGNPQPFVIGMTRARAEQDHPHWQDDQPHRQPSLFETLLPNFGGSGLHEHCGRPEDATGQVAKQPFVDFAVKEALFHEIVTPKLAGRLLRARVRELRSVGNWLTADARGSAYARALRSGEYQLVVLILLRGAEGTRYGHVRGLMVGEMTRLAWRYMIETQGEASLSPLMRFMLERTFSRTIDTIADTLGAYEDGLSIQAAIALFWRYQFAGLQSLMAPKEP